MFSLELFSGSFWLDVCLLLYRKFGYLIILRLVRLEDNDFYILE